MAEARGSHADAPSVGPILQSWRRARQLSQLALANRARVSSRHLSFIETGRSKPSREMVLRLANVLDVPLRERNTLLLAAGFAPVFRESNLDAPALAAVRGALDAILRQQEPYPAVVMNRHWDILLTNSAATRFFGLLLGERPAPGPPSNVLRLMFHPEGLRPFVRNWESVAESLVRRVHREAVGGVPDEETTRLLAEVLAYAGVPQPLRDMTTEKPLLPVVPVSFRKDELAFDFFSAVTTLGTPQDVTLQEIRIECFFPVDDRTARAASSLAGGTGR